MRPTILTPEWVKKKKMLSDELIRKGKLFYTLERQKRKYKKVI
jgi:hypothetical protein